MKERICEICGKPFIPTGRNQNICGSDVCRKRRQVRRTQESRARHHPVEPRVCEICGEVFKPKNQVQKTCSKDCSWERENRMRREKRRQKRAEEGKTWVCSICGREMDRRGKYCSRECGRAGRDGSAWREFYPETKGLIRKWSEEGLPVWQIAQLLGRHHSQIEEALGR